MGILSLFTKNNFLPPLFPQKICGVAVHPKYGGWFAIRGVLIFHNVQVPDLPRMEPDDCVPEQDKRQELLVLFNDHWRDWRFRDIINPQERYSKDQMLYFDTLPKDRKKLVQMLRDKYKEEDGSGDGSKRCS